MTFIYLTLLVLVYFTKDTLFLFGMGMNETRIYTYVYVCIYCINSLESFKTILNLKETGHELNVN